MNIDHADPPGVGDVEGWKYRYTAAVPGFGRISFWRHETGAGHLYGWDVPGKAAFVLTFRSESENDRGVAHVLEHLAGAGSRRYPFGSAIYTAMFRAMIDFANGFTETGRTSYTFVTADIDDYALMLDVLLDGVYWPLLGEREFLRDGARHSLPAAADASGYITGAVYNEMLLKIEREDEWISRLLARLAEPTGFAQYRHEGTPEAVTALRYEECITYHQQWYWPAYATSFSAGGALQVALGKLDSAHRERAADVRPDSVGAGRRGTEPLSVPRRLLGKTWRVAEARFSGDKVWDWVRALALAGDWRRAMTSDGLDVVSIPCLMGGVLSAWCAVRGGNGKTGAMSDLADVAAKALTTGHAANMEPQKVAAHLSGRYGGMPNEIRWGLALAPLCVSGIDQATFWNDDERADWPEQVPTLAIRDVSPDACHEATDVWSPERAASDSRTWLGAGIPRDARVLPIRRLGDRNKPTLEFARPLHRGGVYLDRPGPARSYQHLILGLDLETICLLQPVSDVIRRRLRRASVEDDIGACAVRSGDEARPLVDLVLPDVADSVELWSGLLQDGEVMAEIAGESASWHKQLKARVVTRPAEVASRICAARACAAGRANEFLSGCSSVHRLQALLEDSSLLAACVKRLGGMLDGALTLPIVVGGDAGRAQAVTKGRAVPTDGTAAATLGSSEVGQATAEVPPLLMKSAVSCSAWNAAAIAEPDWPALLVTTAHMRRYLHERVREEGGAYGVTAQADILTRTVVAWSQADAVPERTLEICQIMWTEALDQASEDDVETAKLMAVQTERARRAAVTYLVGLAYAAPCLSRGFADLVDRVDIESMRRVGIGMAAEPFSAMSLPRRGTATII